MSIDAALYTAMSSLDLQQQQADVISSNIANASTPGYADRTLPQLEAVAGGDASGVMAAPLQRLSNAVATDTANQTAGAQAYSQTMVNGLTSYTQVLGQPSDTTSLPAQLSALNTALTSLSASPDEPALQTGAVTAAQNLVGTFNTLSASVASAREQADQNIAVGVTTVNQTLDQLAQNEAGLQQASASGESTAAFQDTQNQLLSTLSQQLPIKVYQESNDGLIVTTDGGTTLLDGSVDHLSFTPTATIPANMQQTGDPATGMIGGLSGVTVNGQPIAVSQNGSIAANLQLRDVTLPAFNQQLDQLAGNTIVAFQQADPTVGSGQTGIFTANGAAVNQNDPAQIPGLAASISLNASVDPTQGGEAWRMLDGAQATTQGSTSSNSTVLAFIQGLNQAQSYDTSSGLPGSMTLTAATSEVTGLQQSTLTNWTATNTSATQQAQSAQTALTNATGVNIDDEMQKLLIVQQSYAATTEVIQAAAKMMDELTSMGT
jgi:flagellar hook-associated protein 1 FlgK